MSSEAVSETGTCDCGHDSKAHRQTHVVMKRAGRCMAADCKCEAWRPYVEPPSSDTGSPGVCAAWCGAIHDQAPRDKGCWLTALPSDNRLHAFDRYECMKAGKPLNPAPSTTVAMGGPAKKAPIEQWKVDDTERALAHAKGEAPCRTCNGSKVAPRWKFGFTVDPYAVTTCLYCPSPSAGAGSESSSGEGAKRPAETREAQVVRAYVDCTACNYRKFVDTPEQAFEASQNHRKACSAQPELKYMRASASAGLEARSSERGGKVPASPAIPRAREVANDWLSPTKLDIPANVRDLDVLAALIEARDAAVRAAALEEAAKVVEDVGDDYTACHGGSCMQKGAIAWAVRSLKGSGT